MPVAEYRRASSTWIQRRDKATLALVAQFEVADHIGCVAVADGVIWGGNWDSTHLYRWRLDGTLIDKRANPTGTKYQDIKIVDGHLVASGLGGPDKGAIDWVDPTTLAVTRRIVTGATDRGVPYTQRGHDGPRRLALPAAGGRPQPALPIQAPMSQPLALVVRAATRADVPALNILIAASARALSVGFYTPEQIDAAVTYVFGVDTGLVDDGTYYVVEMEAQLVGCGGWSRRGALYGGDQRPMALAPRSGSCDRAGAHPRVLRRARVGNVEASAAACSQECRAAAEAEGFTSFELMATLPGVPLYARYGFREVERVTDRMPSGVVLEFVRMRA